MARRVQFCGALNGSVVVRKGETSEQAIERAEITMNQLMQRYAKNLSDDKGGPNIGLEPVEASR